MPKSPDLIEFVPTGETGCISGRGVGTEGEEMNRLRRFYEKVPYGRTSSRVAYATSRAALPEPSPDAEWTEDAAFNAGDAILANPLLKEVYRRPFSKVVHLTSPRAELIHLFGALSAHPRYSTV